MNIDSGLFTDDSQRPRLHTTESDGLFNVLEMSSDRSEDDPELK